MVWQGTFVYGSFWYGLLWQVGSVMVRTGMARFVAVCQGVVWQGRCVTESCVKLRLGAFWSGR